MKRGDVLVPFAFLVCPSSPTASHAPPSQPPVARPSGAGAASEFPGTGGPGGDFDWRVPPGTFVLDTTGTTIAGGPGFHPTTTQLVDDGVIQVRDLDLPAGSTLRCVGRHPVTIVATGTVRIAGTLDASGDGNFGVNGPFEASIPERGASGHCGGGSGGDASTLTAAHTASGRGGAGPFGSFGAGGRPGESAFGTGPGFLRQAGGGGGGRLAADGVLPNGTWDEALLGLNAEPGFGGDLADGRIGVLGALDATGFGPYDAPSPQGGAVGVGPFVDGNPANDFWGVRVLPGNGPEIVGELPAPTAGAGGGGGGDSVVCVGVPCTTFPPPFVLFGAQKGGGGGGGGGLVHVLALGDVVFVGDGGLRARGGFGGHGGPIGNVERVGGGGGGGSGGHVIVQSASRIDFRLATFPTHPHRALWATGGQGGAGRNNLGGANALGERPLSDPCYPNPNGTDCAGIGFLRSAGGDGGPGIVQLHTPNGAADVLLPPGRTLDELSAPTAITDLVLDFDVLPPTRRE